MEQIIRYPDFAAIETEEGKVHLEAKDGYLKNQDVEVRFQIEEDQMHIFCKAETSRMKVLQVRWLLDVPQGVQFLGDEWERSYGKMEWRGMSASRFMPWYFLASEEQAITGYGVKVRPGAMCFWQADSQGITLYLDIRNGGSGVKLNKRILKAATVVCKSYEKEDSFEAASSFCTVMCEDPIFPKYMVYGSNNWYYAYGDSSHQEILADADYLAGLSEGLENRPYMVIDDGWQINHRLEEYNGGPWRSGNRKFPNMEKLAKDLKQRDLRAGIWVRLLLNEDPGIPSEWRLPHNGCLDISHPQVLEYIKDDMKTISGWGYTLIKHDFSTFDIFGKWGFEMDPLPTPDGWHFFDETKTSAELIVDFYQAVLDAVAGTETLILGCNTIGHLGAGLMHMNRTGDDTSGLEWERTRKMGVNTLAFRMPHHKTFYDIDADCVGIAGNIPWKFNYQWAHLLAQSGTSLFLSVKPGILTKQEEEQLREILAAASVEKEIAVPMDWKYTDCPQNWKIEDRLETYDWYEELGVPYSI